MGPVRGGRSVGRPDTRWEDSIARFASKVTTEWQKLAQDKNSWDELEGELVKFLE